MDTEPSGWTQNQIRMLLGVLVLGAVVRCVAVGVLAPREPGLTGLVYPDERDFWYMGAALASGRTMRDEMGLAASRMPAYPAFLSLWMGSDSAAEHARLAQGLIGAVCCAFPTLIAAGLAGPRAGLLAAVFVALDPFAVQFCGLLLTETLFTGVLSLLMVLCWWIGFGRELTARRPGAIESLGWWAAWGLCGVSCVYLHPSALLLIPILGLAMVGRLRRGIDLAGLGVGLIIVVGGLAPWALRNQRVLGTPWVLSSRLGISLYDGVGPRADGSSNLAYTREIPAVQGLGEASWNRWFSREALKHIWADPGRMANLAVRKLWRTWNILPNAPEQRSALRMAVSAGWMVPVLILAGMGLVRCGGRRAGGLFLLIPIAYFTLLHMVFVGSIRYRVPIMPYVEILAAVGLSTLVKGSVGGVPRRFRS